MKKYSQEEINKTKNMIKNKDVPFYFLPSTYLREIVSKGESKYIKDLPDKIKATFLSGDGYLVHQDIILKFLEGTLDDKNSFILSNGEIKIAKDGTKILNKDN